MALLLSFPVGLEIARADVLLRSHSPERSLFVARPFRHEIAIKNDSTNEAVVNLRFRVFQESSSLRVPAGDASSPRTLTILPQQTILEELDLTLPETQKESSFVIGWFDGAKSLGSTRFQGFPNNVLRPLDSLLRESPGGLLDPADKLRPHVAGIPLEQLNDWDEIKRFDGRILIIVDPSAATSSSSLVEAIESKAQSGCAVVWFRATNDSRSRSLPISYVLNGGTSHLIVAHPDLLESFPDSPVAQLRLVHLVELATGTRKPDVVGERSP